MTNTITAKYAHINVVDFQHEKFEDTNMEVVKIRTGLWLLTDEKGDYLTHAKSKKSLLEMAKDFVVKVVETTKKTIIREKRRLLSGNIMKFPFGQKISSNTVKQYVKKVWGGVFKLVEADFTDGYWGGIVEHIQTGAQFQVVRMDYVINYIRPPKGTEEFADVRNIMVSKGVASA